VRDLYREAEAKQYLLMGMSVRYWTARYAARETATALLAEARRVGVTDEQWEALRAVAADVAYD
jgi:hypothetical protein